MRVLAGVLISATLWPALVLAQTASQITPQSFRPPAENPGGSLAAPQPQELSTPDGADHLFVTLSGVDIDGAFATLDTATRALTARLVARRVSGAEIFAAARELEATYAAAGFVLARVILPPQTLVDGARLKLVVVNGFIEKIETEAVPERIRSRVAAVLAPLAGARGLSLAEIERRILLAGDTPGVILHSTLTPGDEQGASILIIDAKHEPVSGLLTLDNSLAESLGRWTLGLGLDLNSISSFGEQIYLRANGDPKFGFNGFLDPYPRNRALAAGLVLPIGIDGLSFNAEGTQARTNPIPTEGIARADDFKRLSLRLRYPWLRSRAANFNAEISFDATDDRQSLSFADVAAPLSFDRMRVMRLSADGNFEAPWGGVVSGRVTASFGLDGLGARTASAATPLLPLSRQFADASFDKIDAILTYSRLLIDHVAINLNARAQTSLGQALVASEQVGIASPSGLSSFDAGTLQGDSGFSLRAEFSSPWALPISTDVATVVISPYAFGAAGAVYLQRPTILESSRLRAASYGLGLRMSGAAAGGFSNGSLTLEWGRQAERESAPIAEPQHGDRFMLNAALRL